MKRRIAALIVTGVLLVGTPAFAADRNTGSLYQQANQLLLKVVKELKAVFRIAAAEELPTPPRP